MGKLAQLRVLVVGLGGVGLETAKNLILAGIKAVHLYDPAIVSNADESVNYYFSSSAVGRMSRAEMCVAKLADLNSYVDVRVQKVDPLALPPQAYTLVMVTKFTGSICGMKEVVMLNQSFRNVNGGFILGMNFGMMCHVFVDFGARFASYDIDGEPVKHALVSGIDFSTGEVFTHNDKNHPFSSGDSISFKEVAVVEASTGASMGDVLASGKTFKVSRVTSPYSFICPDLILPSLQLKEAGGTATQVKVPVLLEFKSLRESIVDPLGVNEGSLPIMDFAKMERPMELHHLIMAAHECRQDSGSPVARGFKSSVMSKFLAKMETEKATVTISKENLIRSLDSFDLEFSPLCGFLGGLLAQEAIKFIGKFTPIRQSLYCDFFEVWDLVDKLGSGKQGSSPKHGSASPKQSSTSPKQSSTSPKAGSSVSSSSDSSRETVLVKLLGREVHELLSKSRVFLVGAGALGCEYLKAFAMLDVATGKVESASGLVTVTDMDRIETSNLNRQFLFRAQHVGKQKSATAADAAMMMNPAMKVKSLECRVGLDSESGVFNDVFWEDEVDIVVNALDNVPSRLYVDGKCVLHGKPLIESGTLGTKGNVQVVLPGATQSYGDSQDPPEEMIPLCTLKNFPNQIEHCIEWARDLFQGTFFDSVQNVKKLVRTGKLENEDQLTLETLEHMKQILDVTSKMVSLTRSNKRPYSKEASPKNQQSSKNQQSPKSQSPNSPEAPSQNSSGKTPENFLTMFASAETLRTLVSAIVLMAANEFKKRFHDTIAQLLYLYPVDYVTAEGTRFWSGPKRAPSVVDFDSKSPTCLSFVRAYVQIFLPVLFGSDVLTKFAYRVDLSAELSDASLAARMDEVKPKLAVFQPKKNYKIKTSETDTTVEGGGLDDEARAAQIKSELLQGAKSLVESQAENQSHAESNASGASSSMSHLSESMLFPAEFEKDDDFNGHVAFIAAAANTRAANYRIEQVDQLKVKLVAGKIVPAIATTTCMIVGLSTVEFVKAVISSAVLSRAKSITEGSAKAGSGAGTAGAVSLKHDIAMFKNAFVNLGTSLLLLAEPMPPKRITSVKFDPIANGPVRAIPDPFTPWDFIRAAVFNAKVKDFIVKIRTDYGVEISIISSGEFCLYNSYLPKHAQRKEQTIGELFIQIVNGGQPVPKTKRFIVLEVSGSAVSDDVDVAMPSIRVPLN